MAGSVYLETTILSYLTARPSRDVLVVGHQQLTAEWWERERGRYRLFVSPQVLEEAGRGDAGASARTLAILEEIETLATDDEVKELAARISVGLGMPDRALGDAVHLACAVHYEIDYLLTWNCAHLANGRAMKALAAFTREAGLWLPIVCAPEELMPEDQGEDDAP